MKAGVRGLASKCAPQNRPRTWDEEEEQVSSTRINATLTRINATLTRINATLMLIYATLMLPTGWFGPRRP